MIRACAAPYNFRYGASVNRPTSCMKLEILWSWAAFGTTQPKAKSKRKRNVNYGGNGRKKRQDQLGSVWGRVHTLRGLKGTA